MQLTKEKKKKLYLFIYHNILTVLGSILLAFGTAMFLTNNNIVSGGLSGIGIIVQHFFEDKGDVIDIVIAICSWSLWFISLFVLGKSFSYSTLVATLVFPLAYSWFYRDPLFETLKTTLTAQENQVGMLILCSVFGGVINGIGIAFTFLGKGSTGGVDVIVFIINKYTGAKVSVVSFIIDALIICSGIFVLDYPNNLVNCLCGIITALSLALMIENIYTKKQNAFIVDVITKETDKLQEYIIKELDRTCTLIDVTGAYTGDARVITRCVLSNTEYVNIKEFIASIDPDAFITFTPTNAVFGEGFQTNIRRAYKAKRNKK